MSKSIIPDQNSGGVPWNSGEAANAAAPPSPFSILCPYMALPSTCEARIMPEQINAIVSELLALAACFNPDGSWNCNLTNNLCAQFTIYRTDTQYGPVNMFTDIQKLLNATQPEATTEDTLFLFVDGAGHVRQGQVAIPEIPVIPEQTPTYRISGRTRLEWNRPTPFNIPGGSDVNLGQGQFTIGNSSPVDIPTMVLIELALQFEQLQPGPLVLHFQLFNDAARSDMQFFTPQVIRKFAPDGAANFVFNPVRNGPINIPAGGRQFWWRIVATTAGNTWAIPFENTAAVVAVYGVSGIDVGGIS